MEEQILKPSQPKVIAFLPWALVENPIKVGRVIFRSFRNNQNEFGDQTTISFLKRLFRCYKHEGGGSVSDLTTCSLADSGRWWIYEDEENIIRDSVTILAFCCMANNQVKKEPNGLASVLYYYNSSNFVTIFQRIRIGNVLYFL
jgi:hypothetical protein